MDDPSEDQSTHELVMPFVSVRSKGGPHDDDAYAAGWEMGTLYADLAAGRAEARSIHAENAGQADLIAMRHGYRTEIGDEQDGWMWLELHRAEGAQR